MLIDDFDDGERFGINQNALGFFAFDDQTLLVRELDNGMLELEATGPLGYYYSNLQDGTSCSDLER